MRKRRKELVHEEGEPVHHQFDSVGGT
jgi:hypothetical protein